MGLSYMDNGYPYDVHASVALLDNRIVNWRVGGSPWVNAYVITFRGEFDFNRIEEVEIKSVAFTVTEEGEHAKAFDEDAKEWFRQWEVADSFKYGKPY